MSRHLHVVAAGGVALLLAAGSARAQSAGADGAPVVADQAARPAPVPQRPAGRDPGRRRSFELTGGIVWLAPTSLGTASANLTSNSGSRPYVLFDSTGELGGTFGFEARGSYHITRMLAVEAGLTFSRPDVNLTIANDAEGAAGFTLPGETISQVFVDAAVVAYVDRLAFARRRGRPFVEAGAGFLRQLHGQSSATSGYYASDSGQVFHIGGGVKYFFSTRPRGVVKAYGVRADARLYFTRNGFAFEGHRPVTAALAGLLVVAF